MKIILVILFVFASFAQAQAKMPASIVNNIYTESIYNKQASQALKPDLNKYANIKKYKNDDQRLVEQARDLEAVLISVMVDPMFPKDEGSGIYGGGKGADIYRMMMIQQYGKILSENNTIGVADNIVKNLK